jgi:hypothetical protein
MRECCVHVCVCEGKKDEDSSGRRGCRNNGGRLLRHHFCLLNGSRHDRESRGVAPMSWKQGTSPITRLHPAILSTLHNTMGDELLNQGPNAKDIYLH